jgi:hypothetical protein
MNNVSYREAIYCLVLVMSTLCNLRGNPPALPPEDKLERFVERVHEATYGSKNGTPPDPMHVLDLINQAKSFGDKPEIIDVLIDVLSHHASYYGFVSYTRQVLENGTIEVQFDRTVMFSPLQYPAAMALADIVKDPMAPSMANAKETEHEWLAEQWRTWWRETKNAEYRKLDMEEVSQFALSGDKFAIRLLGQTDDARARETLLVLLQENQATEQSVILVRAALARQGDAASVNWLAQELGKVSARDVTREFLLLEAVRYVGRREEFIPVLTSLLTMLGANEHRILGPLDTAPPRDYLAARTLSAIYDDQGMSKLHEVSIYNRKDVVRQWTDWARKHSNGG